MTENVIDNTLLKSFNFKTIDEVYKYKNLTVTQQSDYFIKFISYYFRLTKISSGDSKLYYYNEKDKLWSDTKIQQFEAFVYRFFDNTSTEIKMLVKNSKDEIDKYILKQIEKLLSIAWWNWDEQKIRDNAMIMWSDNINEFINKFYENK